MRAFPTSANSSGVTKCGENSEKPIAAVAWLHTFIIAPWHARKTELTGELLTFGNIPLFFYSY